MSDDEYPELEKMKNVNNESQSIGEFLEWLSYEKEIHFGSYHTHSDDCHEEHDCEYDPEHCEDERGWPLLDDEPKDKCVRKGEELRTCGMSENRLYPRSINTENILAEFFRIDLKKIEQEKRDILKKERERRQHDVFCPHCRAYFGMGPLGLTVCEECGKEFEGITVGGEKFVEGKQD